MVVIQVIVWYKEKKRKLELNRNELTTNLIISSRKETKAAE